MKHVELGNAMSLGPNRDSPTRLRRLRRTEALRSLIRENHLHATDLILPIFVDETADEPLPIEAMPGVSRIPLKRLAHEVEAIAKDGVRALMLFGIPAEKDPTGSDTMSSTGLMARMTKAAKQAAPELVVITDNCFCEYTDHGHCGVLTDDGHVHNDQTIQNLGRQAVVAAESGADMVAPSAMMDGQIAAMRTALDAAGFDHLPIMSYSSKFASSFYGPFRAAAGSDLIGDRKTYQADPMNGREALRESDLDEAEGADMLMVKPGLPYLDVLTQIRARTHLPLGVYQASGEYAMIKFAALAGAIDEDRAIRETLGAFKRAGADLILTYFARQVLREGL